MDITKTFTQDYFNKVLNIFPEFIRPNIISILQYIKVKKQTKQCQSVMIYTNNQGPKEWAYLIKNYFEDKLKYKLFNHVISAFKANGKIVEICRKTHDKTIKDFMRCSKLPENIDICYLDDTYHPSMNADNVYYIKINPYTHDLHFDLMIYRFIHSDVSNHFISHSQSETDFFNFMKTNLINYEFVCMEKSKDEYEIDKIITKKIMTHLQSFFNKKQSNSPTSGNKKTLKNRLHRIKTRKNR